MSTISAMGATALVEADGGRIINPTSVDDWKEWVSATETRNYVLGDPLLDWLGLYGEGAGLTPDDQLAGYDVRTDFTEFIAGQGRKFEDSVVAHLGTLTDVERVEPETGGIRELSRAQHSFDAMVAGVSVIHRGVLRDPEHRTYGEVDLLIRSDILQELFPSAISKVEAAVPAPDLGASPWHYRVVDIKFTTLHLSAGGDLGNSGSAPAYKVQVFIYNEALGRIQGYEPGTAYLLGRGWEQTVKGEKSRGTSCMDRLAPVPQSGTIAGSRSTADVARASCDWIRRLRRDGASWKLLPEPSRTELFPYFGNQQDGPWHGAKRKVATDIEDLTTLWRVGAPGRAKAHAAGVYRWKDPRCTPTAVGVTGKSQARTLQALLDVNRTSDGPAVRPDRIGAASADWRD